MSNNDLDDETYDYYRGVKIGTEMAAARIAELEAELAHARLAFGKIIVRHTDLDPDDTWDAMMDEIRARPAP